MSVLKFVNNAIRCFAAFLCVAHLSACKCVEDADRAEIVGRFRTKEELISWVGKSMVMRTVLDLGVPKIKGVVFELDLGVDAEIGRAHV